MSMEFGPAWNRCAVCSKPGETSVEAATLASQIQAQASDEQDVRIILLLGALECGWGLRAELPFNIVCPEHAEDDDYARAQKLDAHVTSAAEMSIELQRLIAEQEG
jgi:hypothetical protein